MWKRIASVVLALGMLAAACGDDDGASADEQAVADALVAKMQEENEPGDPFAADEPAARCFADGIVAEFGLTRLAEVGVTADSVPPSEEVFGAMTDDEVGRAADLASSCADVEALFAAELAELGLSEESKECFVGRLEEVGFVRAAMIAGMRGEEFDVETDEELLGQMTEAAEACLTPEELNSLFGE